MEFDYRVFYGIYVDPDDDLEGTLMSKINKYVESEGFSIRLVENCDSKMFLGFTVVNIEPENGDYLVSAPWLTEDLTVYDSEIRAVLNTFQFLNPAYDDPCVFMLY